MQRLWCHKQHKVTTLPTKVNTQWCTPYNGALPTMVMTFQWYSYYNGTVTRNVQLLQWYSHVYLAYDYF